MAKSGVDSLLDALRASGADVDGKFGTDKKEESEKTEKTSNSSSSQSKSRSNIPESVMESKIVDKFKNQSKKGRIITIIIAVIILGILYWWFHPPINIHSETTWCIALLLVVVPMFFIFGSKVSKYQTTGQSKAGKIFEKFVKKSSNSSDDDKNTDSSKKSSEEFKKEVKDSENAQKAKFYKRLCIIPIGLVVLFLLGSLCSASFFPGNAEKYASVLETKDLDFKQDIKEVNYNQIPVIDRETAIVLGNKEMGAIPDYVSQFEISNHYSQINYRQKPVRVSPLGYADLFKWLTNREAGIPAYCIIDMATQDAKIVRVSDVDGTENQGIKYSESEPLARNIHRHVQLNYPFYMFDEFSFEVDDNGHPWWICPVQERTIGLFGGKNISRVVMCDAVSGECQDMDITEVPQWVDKAYPAELLIEQYN